MSQKGNENKFIQFWTGNKKLEFDFFATKGNHLKRYFYPVLGVLSEQGFVDRSFRKKNSFNIKKYMGMLNIQADFGKDVKKASKCVELILTKVYRIKPEDIEIEVK